MALSCDIYPKVPGTNKYSKLFKDLLYFTSYNREKTKEIYFKTQDPKFIKHNSTKLKLDENGEPTLASLLDLGLKDFIPEQTIASKIDTLEGNADNQGNPVYKDNTIQNASESVKKAMEFNEKSPYKKDFAQTVKTTEGETSTKIYNKTVPRTSETDAEIKRMLGKDRLTQKLSMILQEAGVSIGALTDLEERMGVSGVTDFSGLKEASQGIVQLIRLAKNDEGVKALPEEFSHFAIAALESNPLVQRLISNIVANNLAEEILKEEYEIYADFYKNDPTKLATEAAGKLLADSIVKGKAPANKPYRSLLQRVIDAVKKFFGMMDENRIRAAMLDVNEDIDRLAQGLLEGDLARQLAVKNIKDRGTYYQILTEAEKIKQDRKLINRIIFNENKRLKIWAATSKNGKFTAKQQQLLDDLKSSLDQHNEQAGLLLFTHQAYQDAMQLEQRMIQLMNDTTSPLHERAHTIISIKRYLDSYSHIFEDMRSIMRKNSRDTPDRYDDKIKQYMDNSSTIFNNMYTDYKTAAKPILKEWFRPFFGDSTTIEFGADAGKVIDLDTMIDEAVDGDISTIDRLFESMGMSSDDYLQVGDQAVKYQLEEARKAAIKWKKECLAAGIKLEQAGFKDQEWMFERDAEGNLTGSYISEYNWGEYRRQERLLYERLEKKYGSSNPTGKNAILYNKEKKQWYHDNQFSYGVPADKYKNPIFAEIQKDARGEFYDTMIRIKKDVEKYFPLETTKTLNTIKQRKDFLERLKSSNSLTEGWRQMKSQVGDTFKYRKDDIGYEDKTTLLGFDGREVRTVPIYYINTEEGADLRDYTTDVVSSMIAYAAMAENYKAMNEIADLYEVGRDVLLERKIRDKKGNKFVKEIFSLFGSNVEQDKYIDPKTSNMLQKWDDYGDMNIYGREKKDEGTFGDSNISIAKTGDKLIEYTAINGLGLNLMSNISNVTTGFTQMFTEAVGKKHFSLSDYAKADSIYFSHAPAMLAEMSNRVQVDKLNLFLEKFNVKQDFEKTITNIEFDKKTKLSRIFGSEMLFLGQDAGEHWMQTRTALALANTIKFKSPSGELVSMWDAFEVKYIDDNNHALGANLELKQGYTKEDGSAYTFKDQVSFVNKAKIINQEMHGIYNKVDRAAINRAVAGRMTMLYRRWIPSSIYRRYAKVHKNYDMGSYEEGYYRTFLRFTANAVKGLRQGQIAIGANWKNLTNTEKANIRKSLTEMAIVALLALAIRVFFSDKDRKNRTWLSYMVEYQTRRLYTEVAAMSLTPAALNESLKILKSPSACIQTAQLIIDSFNLLNMTNYEWYAGEDAIIQRGAYKDWSKAQKILYERVPLARTLSNIMHIDEKIQFFK